MGSAGHRTFAPWLCTIWHKGALASDEGSGRLVQYNKSYNSSHDETSHKQMWSYVTTPWLNSIERRLSGTSWISLDNHVAFLPFEPMPVTAYHRKWLERQYPLWSCSVTFVDQAGEQQCYHHGTHLQKCLCNLGDNIPFLEVTSLLGS